MRVIGSMSRVEIQRLYEETYSRRQKRKLLKKTYEEAIKELLEDSEPEDTYYVNLILEVLSILGERKVISLDSLIAMLYEDDFDQSKVIEGILIAYDYGLLRIEKGQRRTMILAEFEPDEETQKRINRFKYLNPMIVKPLQTNTRNNNRGCGYLTDNSSLILGNVYHQEFIDSNVLDLFNKTEFTLNETVIRTIRNSWQDLDKPKKQSLDRPKDETKEEWLKRVEAFKHYEKVCYDAFAEMIVQGNKFYLTHKYDKRGRVYAQGYGINYQGNSYAKAVLEFNKKEVISDMEDFFPDLM